MNLPYQRLVFGLALPGDHANLRPSDACPPGTKQPTFLGEFARKKDADALAARYPSASPKVHAYLHGRRDRGWSVIAMTTVEERASYAYHGCWDAALKDRKPAGKPHWQVALEQAS